MNRMQSSWRTERRARSGVARRAAACALALSLAAGSGLAQDLSATHSAAGYRTPFTNTITCTFSHPASNVLNALLWRPTLPAGWTLRDAAGDGAPDARGGEIVFTAFGLTNTLAFSFMVETPAGVLGTQAVSGEVEYTFSDMVNPATVRAAPDPLPLSRLQALDIASAYGNPQPPTGFQLRPFGQMLSAGVAGSPVTGSATQFVCAGWVGSGSAPATGTTTNTGLFSLTNDARIAWAWRTNLWLDTGIADGTVLPADGWQALGTSAVVRARPGIQSWFAGWTGDVPAGQTNDNPLMLLMDSARSAQAQTVLRPRVVTTAPAGNARAAATSAVVQAVFDRDLQPGTLAGRAVVLQAEQRRLDVAPAYDGPSRTVTLRAGGLNRAPGSRVRAMVSSRVLGVDGVPVRPHTWEFRLAAGAGSGRFAATVPPLPSDSSVDLALGDLDDDGDLDAVVANRGGRPSLVYTNDGSGRFTQAAALAADASWGVALGDLDGNGTLDAVMANDGVSRVYTNAGGGVLVDSGQALAAGQSRSIALGDLNGDGALDAVFANDFGPDVVFTNNGAGVFGDTGQRLGHVRTWAAALGDVNGDGALDAVMVGVGPDQVYTNDGYGQLSEAGAPFGTGDSRDAELGDLNGDGALDLVVANIGASTVYRNDGTGHFVDTGAALGSGNGFGITLADLNADGHLDLFLSRYAQADQVYLNDGAGLFSANGQELGAGKSWRPAAGDVDGDGAVDIGVAQEGEPGVIWINRLPPAAPTVLPATAITAYGFTANWSATARADAYTLDVATNAAFGAADVLPDYTARLVGAETTAVVTNLTPQRLYYYRVRAVNAGGVGDPSAAEPVTTLMAATLGVTPATLSFGIARGEAASPKTFIVTNSGGMALAYTNLLVVGASPAGWVTAPTPAAGVLAPGAFQIHTVHLQTAEAPLGTFTATNAVFAAEATNSPLAVAISLVVTNPIRTLSVQSQYGGVLPPAGPNDYVNGASVIARVTNSPAAGPAGTRYSCMGWIGSGSVPAIGSATNTGSFVITNVSSIAWLWQTQHLLNASAPLHGSVTCSNGWYASSATAAVSASPSNGYHFTGWTGDVPPANSNDAALLLPMALARTLTAQFAADEADLRVSAAVTSGAPIAGSPITYTVTVTNAGPFLAQGVTSTADPGPAAVPLSPLVQPLGTLPVGGAVTYAFEARVAASAATPLNLTNRMTVTSATLDPLPANNSTTHVSTVTAAADVRIAKRISGGSTTAGEDLVYTLTVTNAGPSWAAAVTVTDNPSAGMTTADALVTNLGTLVTGGTTSYLFTVTLSGGVTGIVTNRASVSSITPDPVPQNNAASAASVIGTEADLGIAKRVTGGTAVAGESVQYTLTVTNHGPSEAQNVWVTEWLPDAFSTALPLTTNLGTLAALSSASVVVPVAVAASALGPMTNRATVASDTLDPSSGNNEAAAGVLIVATADVAIAQEILGGPPVAGSPLAFRLTVSNSGPSLARNLVVTNELPAGMGSSDPQLIALGDLSPGAATALTVNAWIEAAALGMFTNTALVTGETADPAPANNRATASGSMEARADLGLGMVLTNTEAVAGATLGYAVTLTNAGPSLARDVQAAFLLSAGLSFRGPAITNVGSIGPGASRAFIYPVLVDADAAGAVTNQASLSSAANDPQTADNTAMLGTTVVTRANVSVRQQFSGGTLIAGDPLAFAITVANAGPSVARNVRTTITPPPRSTTTQALVTNAVVLAAGAATTLTFQVTTDLDERGVISNSVAVAADTPDPASADNQAVTEVNIDPPVYQLVVGSEFGGVTPPRGTNTMYRNTAVDCTLTGSPVEAGTTQYVCTGWVGSGSIPADGDTMRVGATLTSAVSTVTWRWTTNVWLDVLATTDGSMAATSAWYAIGQQLSISATPHEGFRFERWLGDVPESLAVSNPASLPMDRARTIGASFVAVAPRLYVDAGLAGGAATGLSWEDAFRDLGQALARAVVSQELWVAAGVYRPGTARTNSFALQARIPVLGGFTNGMGLRSARNGTQHATVLSGDIGVAGVGTDNCYHVVSGGGGVTLDGFRIQDGWADGEGAASIGAGALLSGAAIGTTNLVTDCVWVSNHAVTAGGALHAQGELLVARCTFAENEADTGGGMQYEGQQPPYRVTVLDSLFSANRAVGGDGGGLCVRSTNPFASAGMISNCVFVGNSALQNGGGAYSRRLARPIVDCLFVDNAAGADGGGLYAARHGSASIGGNVLAGNRAGRGGGLVVEGDSPVVHHGLLAGNVADSPTAGGGGLLVLTGSAADAQPSLISCSLVENRALSGTGHALWSGAMPAARAVAVNSILWDDTAASLIAPGGGAITGDHSCIKGGLGGTGNTDRDPLFMPAILSSWDGSATFDPRTGRSQMMASITNWAGVDLGGYFVNPDRNQPRQFLVESNDAASLTVFGDVTGLVSNGAPFGLRDYRLASTNSPCVDTGVFVGYGYQGSAPDMGAYEWGFLVSMRVLLEGPFRSAAGVMSDAAGAQGLLPVVAPYLNDPRTVAAVPTNAVDWVLFSLSDTPEGTPVSARSAFVDADGYLLADDGSRGLLASAPAREYYFAIRHRNHLAAMSAAPVALVGATVAYDFTTAPSQVRGGESGLVEVAAGRWALAAGDADGDGEVLAVDGLLTQTQSNGTGYVRGDLDLDGLVTADEFTRIGSRHLGRRSALPEPATLLIPTLGIRPAQLTLLAGDGALFHASDSTGTVHWAFARNRSGSTSIPTVSQDRPLTYFAGTNAGQVDILECWDPSNRLARAVVNVLGTGDVAQAGNAIIIAGRKAVNDPLWPTTDYLSASAFQSLLYRGYGRDHVQMLSPEPGRDIDDNGWDDDIDAESTWANASQAVTNGAASRLPLFLYMVDHGASDGEDGYMRLSATERISATELDRWLDALQDAYSNDVVVVLDFCQAGSFVPRLDYTGTATRIVMASCSADEPAYFIAGGLVSFSDAFFTGVLLGLSVSDSFALAADSVSAYQTPLLADSGNAADRTFVGAMLVAGQDVPRIGRVVSAQSLMGGTVATLWAGDIVSPHPLARVWCSIVPPDHRPADPANPVVNLVNLDLFYNEATGRYEADYNGFAKAGVYKLLFYALDVNGGTSLPVASFINQSAFREKVILVAGGPTHAPEWNTINTLANLAYQTFRIRLFDAEHIVYLNAHTAQDADGEPGDDVDGVPTLQTLGDAITNGAGQVDALTLLLIGTGNSNTVAVSGDESLDADQLAAWLNAVQHDNRKQVNAILDFSGSGAFLPALADYDPGQQPGLLGRRVSIASSKANRSSLIVSDGDVSFSQFFLSGIAGGQSIGAAATEARRLMRRASGDLGQMAEIDDDENGLPNEKDIDGVLSRSRFIGTAFATGNDVPTIGAVLPPTTITNTSSVLLWASGVNDVEGDVEAWCLVTPPGFDGSDDLPRVSLAVNPLTGRHEGLYTNITAAGTYALTFFARDAAGQLSAPLQSAITRIAAAVIPADPDAYEDDDAFTNASPFILGTVQTHTFHTPADADWVSFYAVSNLVYDIETRHQGTNLDTVVDLYFQADDGTLQLLDSVDLFGATDGELAGLDFPRSGFCLVHVRQYPRSLWTAEAYELRIAAPSAGEVLVVVAVDKLNSSHAPPGAVAILDGSTRRSFGDANSVSFASISRGWHRVEVTVPAGYDPEQDPKAPNQVANASSVYYGNPKQVHSDSAVAVFQFVPQSSISGRVRDWWSGAPIPGVSISFTARNGIIAGRTYSGFPAFTSYTQPWYTQNDGTFPPTLILPAVDWDLVIAADGYYSTTLKPAVWTLTPGVVRYMGDLFLAPIDGNHNGIADRWEMANYGRLDMPAWMDTDGDGHNSWLEYLLGTNPQDAGSVLAVRPVEAASAKALSMTWPVNVGHSYAVERRSDLPGAGGWTTVAGPWVAPDSGGTMSWTHDGSYNNNRMFYRVRATMP